MVMGDSEGPGAALACLDVIESIRDAATRSNVPAVASVASSLIGSLPLSAQPATLLGDGIAALQRALEQPAPSAPGSFSPAHDPELMGDFILESGEHLTN